MRNWWRRLRRELGGRRRVGREAVGYELRGSEGEWGPRGESRERTLMSRE